MGELVYPMTRQLPVAFIQGKSYLLSITDTCSAKRQRNIKLSNAAIDSVAVGFK